MSLKRYSSKKKPRSLKVVSKKNLQATLLALCLTSAFAVQALAGNDNEELSYLYGDDDFISIATGHKQRIAEAPAVASVITSADIRAMGAQDLDQVLESVPGLHVAIAAGSYNPIYTIRGIYSGRNPQTLVLINSFPITNLFTGNRGEKWGGMPVEMISRIEVIRGPGSALYGADALSGVINIITKNATDIGGLQMGASHGSFDTQRGWLLYGGQARDWDIAFGVEVLDTSGHQEKIDADNQTLRDGIDMTSASLAPGSVNVGKQGIDMRLDLEKERWRVRAGYQGRRDVGTGAGINQALDPASQGSSDRINLDVTYQHLQLIDSWDFEASLSYFDTALENDKPRLLPPGADFTLSGGDPFPDGLIGEPSFYERHYRYDMSAFFSGVEGHRLRFGAGYHYLDLYRVEERKNFDLTMGPPMNLGAVIRVRGDSLFNEENSREVTYFFAQDEWRMARDWQLIAGLRYDHFSDFGDTLNPRLALVWSEGDLTSKLLYGRAFRAPSSAEQFNKNNPVAIGNSNLDPETIETYELAFDYASSPDMRLGLNFFYYKMDDIIRFTPLAMNTGAQTGKGFELEFDWQVSPFTQLTANYAFQHSRDKETGQAAANAPEQQLYLRLDQQLLPKWSLCAKVNGVFDRNRAAGDTRKDIDDYVTLDLTLTGKELLPGVTATLSIFNAADEDAREPSLYESLTNSTPISNDLPLAGRSFVATIRKAW